MLVPAFARRSYDALSPRRQSVWRVLRWLVPSEPRWFFEGCLDVRGQLWYSERKLLYQTIRAFRPMTVFEVGTWYGGGSTLFISQALHDNGAGRLFTVELDPARYSKAVDNYQRHLLHLLPYVDFSCGSSTDVFKGQLPEKARADVLMLDGFGAEQSKLEFEFFLPHLQQGSVFIAHDWLGEKMSLVRPLIENHSEWQCLTVLKPPQSSVGMVVFQKTAR